MPCITTPDPLSLPEAGPSRPALFTRLQTLLPQSSLSAHLSADGNNPSSTSAPPLHQTFLKVRIVTWNMHESIPKGDLQELLGQVPTYTSPIEEHSSTDLPRLPNNAEHAYHLIVVAGQECPSLSGIPHGLGAGFRLGSGEKEKEKDKERDKDKDRDHDNVEHESPEPLIEKRGPKSEQRDEEPVPHTTGWTSVLEDFFVHGMTVVGPSARAKDKGSQSDLGRSYSTGDIRRRPKTGTKGPYELLVKERLMGIYLAIFVHRDAKHLVRGTSKSAVTAGLIGGRVGNKGAVGISLKIANTTMLFVNAHLAAHEGRVPNRLANLAKIKNELAVDDFLKPDDPRMVAEDITDRFDFTFLFGDLNFRLDLSRLHADWLISRREYAQALAFDQLFNIMRNGQAFVGFHEATINFPPTFKYDVLRTIRHRRRRSKHAQAAVGVVASLSQEPDDAGEQPELEGHHDCGRSEVSSEDDTNGELASVISSGTTYSHRDQLSDEDNDSGAESDYLRRRMALPQRGGALVKRISMSAAQRAKSKWAELIHAPSSQRLVRSPWVNTPTIQVRGNSRSPRSVPTTPLLGRRSTSSTDHPPDGVLASASPLMRARVQPSPSLIGNGIADTECDRGVYDSSSKQRVPSWCDRILFKSTVKPDPEPEDEPAAPQRNAVSLLAQAWRSFRRSSSSSLRSATATSTTFATSSPSSNPISSTIPADSEPGDAVRPPPTPYVPRRRRVRPHSIDIAAPTPSQSTPLSTARPGTSSVPPMAPSALTISSDHHHGEPSPVVRMPMATPAGNTARSTTSPTVGGGTTTLPSGVGGRHPRWRLIGDGAAAAPNITDNVRADSPTRMAVTGAPSSSLPGGEPGGASAAPAESPRPRKGDIPGRPGMRRLEGRSDHRPVIGVYAIYV
ncbi:hypothetical protein BJV77DRAFT_1018835 [Russula vinacea]|nr:hypothetical protein BJV77DRAFT_1018835 [Russula vinacea]